MKYKDFYSKMNGEERAAYAEKVGTTVHYLSNMRYKIKPTAIDLIARMILASDGNLTLESIRPDLYRKKADRELIDALRKAC